MNDHIRSWLKELRTAKITLASMEQTSNVDKMKLIDRSFREQLIELKGRVTVQQKIISDTIGMEVLEIFQAYNLTITEGVDILEHTQKLMLDRSKCTTDCD